MTSTPDDGIFAQPGAAPASFDRFTDLPRDIQLRIVTMACWLPAASALERAKPSDYDTATTHAIALVCKDFHKLAAKFLFKNICITRPSTLRWLVATIVNCPQLGECVKNLHIGPNDALPIECLPVQNGKLIVSMSVPTDEGRCPSWLFPRPYTIHLQGLENRGPPQAIQAILDAVDAVSRHFMVDLTRLEYSYSGEILSANKWYDRTIDVFAAIELYILEMGRCERRFNSLWEQGALSYPPLVIDGQAGLPPPGAEHHQLPDAFLLTREQIQARRFTPKGSMDRFDHPALFIRSDMPWQVTGVASAQLQGGDTTRQWTEDAFYGPLSSAEAAALPSASDLRSVLNLARTLLDHTSLLHNLSVTGFLQQAVSGPFAPPGRLSALCSASFGPPPERWSWAPTFHPTSFVTSSVRRLRICGQAVQRELAAELVGGAMPCLQSAHWDCWDRIRDSRQEDTSQLLDVISILAGCRIASARNNVIVRESLERAGNYDEEFDPLFVEAQLNARDLARVLNVAPDLSTREAWKEGDPPAPEARCRRRFHVMNNSVIEEGFSHNPSIYRRVMARIFDERREWFAQTDQRQNEA